MLLIINALEINRGKTPLYVRGLNIKFNSKMMMSTIDFKAIINEGDSTVGHFCPINHRKDRQREIKKEKKKSTLRTDFLL